jgi:hypothetical protein
MLALFPEGFSATCAVLQLPWRAAHRNRDRPCVGAGAFGMHDTLGNAFTVKVCQFFEQVVVLDQDRSRRTGGTRVLIVADRCCAVSG